MKAKRSHIFCCFLITGLLYACDDAVITPPQKDNKVYLSSPVNRLVTPNHNQLFSWAAVAGAESYQLQIASPHFYDGPDLLIDTITQLTTLNIRLSTGPYQWCVNAINPGSKIIPSDTNTLTIH
jgi:hypothetical protein